MAPPEATTTNNINAESHPENTKLIDDSPDTINFKAYYSGGKTCKEKNVLHTIGEGPRGHGVKSLKDCLELASKYEADEFVFEKDKMCQACSTGAMEGDGDTHFYIKQTIPASLQISTNCCRGLKPCKDEFMYQDRPKDGTPWEDRRCRGLTRCTTNQYQFKAPVKAEGEDFYIEDRQCRDLNLCTDQLIWNGGTMKSLPTDGSASTQQTCRSVRKCCPSDDPRCGTVSFPEYIKTPPKKTNPLTDPHYTENRQCEEMDRCAGQLYTADDKSLSVNGTSATNRTCKPVTECQPGEYEVQPPRKYEESDVHYTHDRECAILNTCKNQLFNNTLDPPSPQAATLGTPRASHKPGAIDNNCLQTNPCQPDEYIVELPKGPTTDPNVPGEHFTSDYKCAPLDMCKNKLFSDNDKNPSIVKMDGSGHRNRECKEPRKCSKNHWKTVPQKVAADAHYTIDTACHPMDMCVNKLYANNPRSDGESTVKRDCTPLTECQTNQYQSAAPQKAIKASGDEDVHYATDRECTNAILTCAAGQWLDATIPNAKGVYPGPNVCRQIKTCTDDEFQPQPNNLTGVPQNPTETQDRICRAFKTDLTQYGCDITSEWLDMPPRNADGFYERDRVCQKATLCKNFEYILRDLTTTGGNPSPHDRVCASLKTHSKNADSSKDCTNEQWLNMPPKESKFGQYTIDRECVDHTKCDAKTEFVKGDEKATTEKDRTCRSLKPECGVNQAYDVPPRDTDTGYFSRDRNCDAKKEGGEVCNSDEECMYGICHAGYHAEDKPRCNCEFSHWCPNMVSKCPLKCVENNCNLFVSQWGSCGNTTDHKTKARDVAEAATGIKFDGPWDCSGCTKNICPDICSKYGCTDFWNQNVSEDEKCGISTQYQDQDQHVTDGVLGGPWDCRNCRPYGDDGALVQESEIAPTFGTPYTDTFTMLDEGECKSFAASFRRKIIPDGEKNKMGYAPGLTSGKFSATNIGKTFNDRSVYQSGIRKIENNSLPKGCLFSDYYLRFYYNSGNGESDTDGHRRRVGTSAGGASGL